MRAMNPSIFLPPGDRCPLALIFAPKLLLLCDGGAIAPECLDRLFCLGFVISEIKRHQSRFRREQHLAAALCGFGDRFADLVETVSGDDRSRDRAGGDQRRQMIEHRRDLVRRG